MPQLHIGMPVYNGERFLAEALESLLAQSYADFVLHISDDASTDKTKEICEAFATRDQRIVYHRKEKNIGMFANFKFVLDQAKAPYFMWAAQDDIREKEYIARCISWLEKHTESGVATSVVALIDASGRTLAEEHEVAALSDISTWQRIVRYTLMSEGLGKANLMYGVFRTTVARAVWSAYPQRRVWGQDYVFTLALVSRFSVHIDPSALFKKRLGGYSSPTLANGSLPRLSFKERNNGVPLLRFAQYWRGSKEALAGTFWWPLVAMFLLFRLPRSLFVYMTERDYRKFFNRGRTLL